MTMLMSALLFATSLQSKTLYLDSLDLSRIEQGWGQAQANKSVDGTPISLGGQVFAHGVGTHANSKWMIDLHGAALRFEATVGADDEKKGAGSVGFEVWVDGHKKASTKVFHGGDAPEHLSVDLTGAKRLDLVVNDGGDGIDSDHADWADAKLVLRDSAKVMPNSLVIPVEPPMPIYMGGSKEIEINGPRVLGCTPGHPFLFLIPAATPGGTRPSRFDAYGLPQGLTLDPTRGIISGTVPTPGQWTLTLVARDGAVTASRTMRIVAGDHKLTQTPPMGWNSWNVWAGAVDANKVRAAADGFLKTGLANYGYSYVNIDDTWEGARDAKGEITTNEKFGDMKALSDYVHMKGLKLGIYSSPGPTTCAGFPASYVHEMQDAQSYAKWGIDYLKYDWCSYNSIAPSNPSLEDYQKPYIVMRNALDKVDRDIVYSLCQYGMGDVYKWGKQIGGNLWRTTGDINDSWSSLSGIAFQHSEKAFGAGPGGWNDPDMLVVGNLGWGPNPHPTKLTPNEQITHIGMWAMLGAPLLIGCDLTTIDRFTMALLTNHDIIEIDQDPLGKVATRRAQDGDAEVWARPLADGSMAVALVNRAPASQKVTAHWKDLGLNGSQPIYDVWRRMPAGMARGSFSRSIPAHGAMIFRVGRMSAG